jgi:hypothetical protein
MNFLSIVRDTGLYAARVEKESTTEYLVLESPDIVTAQIAYHPSGHVKIVFVQEVSGVNKVYMTESRSWCESWTTKEFIVNGDDIAFAIDERLKAEYVAIWRAGTWELWRSGVEEDEMTFVSNIVSAPQTRAGLEISPSTSNDLIFWYGSGTSISRKFSQSYGVNWS